MPDRSRADAYTRIDHGVHDRYRKTRVHLDETTTPAIRRYGIWRPPTFTYDGSETRHTVTSGDVGHIDAIAKKYYGDERLWWVIAWANNIKNPITDMSIGQQLMIPNVDRIAPALEDVI